MKKFSIIALLFAIFAFASCEKDKGFNQKTEISVSADDQKKVNYLKERLGFSDVIVKDSYLIGDGDLLFDKNNFWENYMLSETNNKTNRVHYYTVSATKYIPVYFNNIPDEWKTAVKQAMKEWNNLNGDIYFYTKSSSSGAFVINFSNPSFLNMSTSVLASTMSPGNDGYYGVGMYINPSCSFIDNVDYSQRKYLMVHELGHALGFRHTDSYDGLAVYNTEKLGPIFSFF